MRVSARARRPGPRARCRACGASHARAAAGVLDEHASKQLRAWGHHHARARGGASRRRCSRPEAQLSVVLRRPRASIQSDAAASARPPGGGAGPPTAARAGAGARARAEQSAGSSCCSDRHPTPVQADADDRQRRDLRRDLADLRWLCFRRAPRFAPPGGCAAPAARAAAAARDAGYYASAGPRRALAGIWDRRGDRREPPSTPNARWWSTR
jgi:hypothetical protein